jgi:hypothetical protein
VFDDRARSLGRSTWPTAKRFARTRPDRLAAAEEVKTGRLAADPARGRDRTKAASSSSRTAKDDDRSDDRPAPTVGLVFYDLKSALRSVKPAPRPRAKAAAKPKPKPAAEEAARQEARGAAHAEEARCVVAAP